MSLFIYTVTLNDHIHLFKLRFQSLVSIIQDNTVDVIIPFRVRTQLPSHFDVSRAHLGKIVGKILDVLKLGDRVVFSGTLKHSKAS